MKSGNRARIILSPRRVGMSIFAVLSAVLAACAAEGADSSGGPIGAGGAGGPVTVLPPAGQGGSSGTGGQPAGGSGGQPVQSMGGAGGSSGGAGSGTAGQAGGPLAGTGGLGAGGMAGAAGASGNAAPPPTGDICARWKADRVNLTEAAWSGSADSCEAGDMTEQDRATAYRLHSLYRFMAGLEPVEMTDEGNRLAQGCALLMTANGMLSHTPSASWTCHTEESADTAGKSSLSPGSAISSVDGYMIDPGNPTTLGHRRWILSNMLAGVGFGSTGRFSCQYQPPKRPAAGAKPWIAWPPPGQVPFQSFGSRFATVDETGWSVQSDTIDLQNADVTVTSGGTDLAVTVTPLNGGYGSTHAIRFNPMGWTTEAGKTYSVSISGASMPIAYEVEVVDCP
jgi:hypothetical protein